MAENGAVQEKVPLDDVETGVGDHELDDSKAKFINGSLDETRVEVRSNASPSKPAFTGLGKDELKKYAEDPFWVRLRWILFILFWVGWLAMLVSAILIIVFAPKCPSRPDLKWYHKDVSYNVYGKSFYDGDDKDKQDGVGDLAGVQAKEKYLEGLGATSLWLSGVLKTDEGKDRAVQDFKGLDAKFGTMGAFRNFCKKLFKKGKRVIMDINPVQTSKEHDWFKKSQAKDAKYDSYYIWQASPPAWTENGKSMWVADSTRGESYLSHDGELPALNLQNGAVIKEFHDIIHFWAGAGVSGFHMADLEHLAVNKSEQVAHNNPANAQVVDSFMGILNSLDNKPGKEKLMFGTLSTGTPEALALYKGGKDTKGLSMVAVRLDKAMKAGNSAAQVQEALMPMINATKSAWLAWRLTSADPMTERAASMVGDAKRMIAAQALQALLPGSSLPYYGDEIAMTSGATAGQKTVTPMQWSKAANAGFSKKAPWLAVNGDYTTRNVDSMTAQLGDNHMMDGVKALNKLREEESLQFGQTAFCTSGDLLIFARKAPGFPSFVVIINYGADTAHKFSSDACVGKAEAGELVFHSHEQDHVEKQLDLKQAVLVKQGEVMVLKFPPA